MYLPQCYLLILIHFVCNYTRSPRNTYTTFSLSHEYAQSLIWYHTKILLIRSSDSTQKLLLAHTTLHHNFCHQALNYKKSITTCLKANPIKLLDIFKSMRFHFIWTKKLFYCRFIKFPCTGYFIISPIF